MLLHWFALHVTLRHPLVVNWLLQQPVASAGSLAVIFQPAFVHFVYVLVITCVFLFSACAVQLFVLSE